MKKYAKYFFSFSCILFKYFSCVHRILTDSFAVFQRVVGPDFICFKMTRTLLSSADVEDTLLFQTENYKLDRLTKIRPGGPFLLSKGLSTRREKLFTGELDLFYWYILLLFVQILTRDTKAPSTDQCRHNWLVMFLIRPPIDCSNMIKEENWKSYATATTIFIDSWRAQLANQIIWLLIVYMLVIHICSFSKKFS